ncbi:MAG: EAL domain-containing protein [Synechocystis sp.]|nr:EAL domain-containing protein [Synechocystis sp.]
MLYQLVVDSPSFKKVIRIQNSCYSIGRHPSNNIVIPSPQVSRRHATLIKKINPNLDISFHIIDGDLEGHRSRNGVWVNGESYLERELNHGDVIALAEDIQIFYQVIPNPTFPEEDSDDNRLSRLSPPELAVHFPQEQWDITLIHHSSVLDNLTQEQLTKLAACIEYSPYPMVEIDYFGNLTYVNAAAQEKFPTLAEEKLSHPLLKEIVPDQEDSQGYYMHTREVAIGDKFYEQHIHYPAESQFIRSYIFDITERKVIEKSLNYQAFYDPLTDLPNRFLFTQEFSKVLSNKTVTDSPLGLVLLGFRELQSLNDLLGHSIADDVLKIITERLAAHVRVEDLLCRWRGDTFILLITSCKNKQEIEIFVQRLLLILKRPFFIANNPLYLNGYAGIACYPENGDNVETLLNRVGVALNEVKDIGIRQYCFFEDSLNSNHLERIQLEHALHQALERNEFLLHYQPIVNVKSGSLSGVEALIRWRHPEQGLMSPGSFMGLLETTGLIIPVGEWILRTAFQHFKQWQQHVDDDFRIAINLSPQQFQAPDLLPTIFRILEENALPPKRLEVEITENIVMQNVIATQNLLNALKSHGIRLSMDDFGTGYSSLSYLKTFPFNTLKIDRSFTKDILETPKDAAIIQAMLLLGDSFDLNIVAEGIETEAQARRLVELGCSEMQGYWFSRPMSHSDLTEFLQAGGFHRFILT